jgi:ParB-like chromosome segregation protein Spo0J
MKREPLPEAKVVGVGQQPLMQVEWVLRDTIFSNFYNPNHVSPIEMTLLKISILEDGWTQPIVARLSGEIVDGFHRWLCAAEPLIAAMTDGMVPVVRLREVDKDHQIMSTIRHNRARGTHAVLKMADIVRDLIDEEHMSYEEVQRFLQMEWEEVDRLYDRGGMLKRASKTEFNTGWVPGKKEDNHV